MNKIQIFGRLGADPVSSVTPKGQKVTEMRVATNSRRSGKDETTWWRITIWGEHKLIQYFKKGSAIFVTGELKARIYMDKAGQPQMSLEVTADNIEFNPFGSGTSERAGGDAGAGAGAAGYAAGKESGEAPFQGYTDYSFNAGAGTSTGQFAGKGSGQTKNLDDDLPF